MITKDNPIILSPNHLTSQGVFTASNGQALTPRLIDRDRGNAWRTQGAGGGQVTIEHNFFEGAFPVPRTFDTFFMLNHNVKRWKLQAWDGSQYVDMPNSVFDGDFSDPNSRTIVQFNPYTANKIRIVLLEPKVGGEYKIGEMILAQQKFAFPEGMAQYEEDHDEKVLEYELAEGTLERAKIESTEFEFRKYRANLQIIFQNEDTRDALDSIKQLGENFLWLPEPVARPERVFLVHWVGRWREAYSTPFKGSGFTIPMELREV
jgi:hypothetical protein